MRGTGEWSGRRRRAPTGFGLSIWGWGVVEGAFLSGARHTIASGTSTRAERCERAMRGGSCSDRKHDELGGEPAEEAGQRKRLGQGDADATHALTDDGSDLQQTQSKRVELRT